MKKLLYLIFLIAALYSSSAKGVWGGAIGFPGGETGNDEGKLEQKLISYGDSIFIFNGKYWKNPNDYYYHYFIYYTLDAGKTWTKMYDFQESEPFLGEVMSSNDFKMSTLSYFPPSTLQFVQYSTATIFRTNDWGKTWSKTPTNIITNPTKTRGVRAFPLDSLRQVFNTWDEKLSTRWARKSYMTYDGWKNFDTVNLPPKCLEVQMVDDSNLVSIFWPNIYYSSNRGKSWDSVLVPGISQDSDIRTGGGYFSIIPNSSTILMPGTKISKKTNYGNIMAWKSTDAGKAWRVVLETKDSIFYGGGKMSFNDKGAGLIVSGQSCKDSTGGWGNVSYISSDYGETWERTPFTDDANGIAYSCVSGSINNMWALIDDKVYHYKGAISGVIDIPEMPLASSGDVYPNPVGRGKTVYLPVNEGIAPGASVKIYSLLGELIDEYIPEESTKLLSYRPDEKLVKGNYYFLIESGDNCIIKAFTVE